ncbi:MAG: rod shape-determining protein [Planctomycetota bacterium]|jgi:rod shape-determining protein MreB|nr:rod shape-determining protein [Planctomycetota bacterium]
MVFLESIFGFFSHDMGIDLGTCNTLVYVRGEGIVLCEPSVVAVSKKDRRVLLKGQAVGERAKRMVGRTPGNFSAIRPMKDGVIADFEMTEAMLKYFIGKVHNFSNWAKPRVVISVPSGITEVEKRAVKESASNAKARKVWIISEPMAAAIGIGLPIDEPIGNMLVDIGGGTTEVAVISMMGMVYCKSIRTAGDELDEAIMNYLRRQYNFIVGETTAERIKIAIGSAYPLEQEMTIDVMGRDQVKGLPRSIAVRSEEVREAFKEPLDQIVGAVVETLENTPPELAGDIYSNGIALAGGGALLRGIDKLIQKETRGIPVHIADDPLKAVARGTGLFIEGIEDFEEFLEGGDEES